MYGNEHHNWPIYQFLFWHIRRLFWVYSTGRVSSSGFIEQTVSDTACPVLVMQDTSSMFNIQQLQQIYNNFFTSFSHLWSMSNDHLLTFVALLNYKSLNDSLKTNDYKMSNVSIFPIPFHFKVKFSTITFSNF